MSLLIFILACYGLTTILVYGKIFDSVRPKDGFLGILFKCSLCIGFWVGIFNWFLTTVQFNFLIAGFISAGTSYFLDKILGDEGIAIKINK